MAYFKKIADDHGLRKYIRLNHKIVGATWVEETQEWVVKVENLETGEVFEDMCNVLVNASGVLKYVSRLSLLPRFLGLEINIHGLTSKWKWPNIVGRETFEGPMLHSANWDTSVSLEGKSVAVIGGGSSAVQIVPNILPCKLHTGICVLPQARHLLT